MGFLQSGAQLLEHTAAGMSQITLFSRDTVHAAMMLCSSPFMFRMVMGLYIIYGALKIFMHGFPSLPSIYIIPNICIHAEIHIFQHLERHSKKACDQVRVKMLYDALLMLLRCYLTGGEMDVQDLQLCWAFPLMFEHSSRAH